MRCPHCNTPFKADTEQTNYEEIEEQVKLTLFSWKYSNSKSMETLKNLYYYHLEVSESFIGKLMFRKILSNLGFTVKTGKANKLKIYNLDKIEEILEDCDW